MNLFIGLTTIHLDIKYQHWISFSHSSVSDSKLCNLVTAKMRWYCVTEKSAVDLAAYQPCITDTVVCHW